MKTKLLLAFLLSFTIAQAQVLPQVYYTFDLTNPLAPAIGSTVLSGGGTYSIADGQVGKSILLNNTTSNLLSGQTVNVIGAVTVEFIMKTDYQFSNNRNQQLFQLGNVSATFAYPNIQFSTQSSAGSDDQVIALDGINQKTWKYYLSGWHHFAFVFNATSGSKQVFIDGILYAGFSKSVGAGNITLSSNQTLFLHSNTSYAKGAEYLDEVAVYNQAITPSQVYSDYLNMVAHNHYTFSLVTPPAAGAVTNTLDINEFPLGYTLGSPTSQNVTNSMITQITTYPAPRYITGNAEKLFNWGGLSFEGSLAQAGVTTPQAVVNSATINAELATNWNYYFLTNEYLGNTNYTDTVNSFEAKMVAVSNRNKQWQTSAISFWIAANPRDAGYSSSVPYVRSQNLQPNSYIRNASGQFLSANGTVTTTKVLSPASPLDSIKQDAGTMKLYAQRLKSAMTDTLNLINDNDEIFPVIDTTTLRQDPAILAGMVTDGFGAAREYLGYRQYLWSKLVRDSIRSVSGLTTVGSTIYQIDGQDGTNGRNYYRVSFKQRRQSNSDPIFGQTSTFDFYPRYPYNWRFSVSAWRGWQPLVEARNTELGLNSPYYTPFVGAGWDVNEENNFRPAQWMGLLKCMALTGARSFYTGYFNEAGNYNPPNPPPASPKGYAWQLAIPSYAQSAADWVCSNSYGVDTLLKGDMPDDYVQRTGYFYGFYSGNPEILTIIRKKQGSDCLQYAIGTTVQRMSNQLGNGSLVDTAVFTVDNRTMSLPTRRQGSVYTVDLNKDTAVVIQYDGYQEYKHPERWTTDFNFEAECYGKYVSKQKDVRTTPYQKSTNSTFNFTNSTTYLTYRDSTSYSRDTLSYQFTQKAGTTTMYVWVRLRSINGRTAGFSCRLDNGTSFTQNLITDTTWKYYPIGIVSGTDTMKYSVANGAHTFKIIVSSARTEIDKILLTSNYNTGLPVGIPGTVNPCVSVTTPTITPSGTTTICTGATQGFLSSVAPHYLWSNGLTTQGITTSIAGSYTVTTTDANGCTATSAPSVLAVTGCACANTDSVWMLNIWKYQAQVKWHKSTTATAYILRCTDTRTGAYQEKSWGTAVNYLMFDKLKNGTTYEVDIQTYCGGTITDKKTIWFVTKQ